MTAPDRITIAKCHPFRGDNFYVATPGFDASGVEYVRRDPAVLAALPEVQALVDAAYERAAAIAEPRIKMWTECDGVNTDLDQAIAAIEGIPSAIRAMKETKE